MRREKGKLREDIKGGRAVEGNGKHRKAYEAKLDTIRRAQAESYLYCSMSDMIDSSSNTD